MLTPGATNVAHTQTETEDTRRRQGRRAERYGLRSWLWGNSTRRRGRSCGRTRISKERMIDVVRTAEGVAHYTNLQRCGSVWGCACCAPKIRDGRTAEVRDGLARWWDLGASHNVYLVTMTARHHRGQSLTQTLDAVAAAWSASVAGRRWAGSWKHGCATNPHATKRSEKYACGGPAYECPHGSCWRHGCDSHERCGVGTRSTDCPFAYEDVGTKRRFGITGAIRAIEITWGAENGWHPHGHILLLTDRRLSPAEEAQLRWALFTPWADSLEASGLERPLLEVGCDVQHIERHTFDVAGYPLKWTEPDPSTGKPTWGPHTELTRPDLKASKPGRFKPEELLAAAAAGQPQALALWEEYERSTAGHQAVTWSAGLKALLLVEERTDEEIVDEQAPGEVVLSLGILTYSQLTRRPGRLALVLDTAEGPNPLPEIEALLHHWLERTPSHPL